MERLRMYDRVRAVYGGPIGTVIDITDRYGWVVVRYRDRYGRHGWVSYKHGEDHLYLEEEDARKEASQ